jgi:hypothetical protein
MDSSGSLDPEQEAGAERGHGVIETARGSKRCRQSWLNNSTLVYEP